MTQKVPTDFFNKDQEVLGQYIREYMKTYKLTASQAADHIMEQKAWRVIPNNPKNGSTLSDSLQARKDELASRARGGDKFAAALVEEREKTGTERGYEGEPA